jgi:hypothetical protein
MRKRVVAAIVGALVGPLLAGVAGAQTVEEERSIGVLCIGRLLDLPFIDVPEETQMIAIVVTDDFKCPSEGIG